MKQTLHRLFMLVVASALLWPAQMFAQLSWSDSFNYPVGALKGNGGWVSYGSSTANPIQVVEQTLSYDGFASVAKGANPSAETASEKLYTSIIGTGSAVKSGTVYVAGLFSVKTAPVAANPVLTLIAATATISEVTDSKSPTQVGKLFMAAGADDSHFKVGVERGGTAAVYADNELSVGQTYLFVIKYALDPEGNGADEVSLFINPSLAAEPATAAAVKPGSSTGSGARNGIIGLSLCNSGSFRGNGADVTFGALVVGDSYAALFGDATADDSGETPADSTATAEPTLAFSDAAVDFGALTKGALVTKNITVKGTGLTSDVTVASSSDELTVSPSTLAASEVMTADGAGVVLTLQPVSETGAATLTFSTEGIEPQTVAVTWTASDADSVDVPTVEPALEVEGMPTAIVAGTVGVSTTVATLTVKATNVPGPVTLYLTGRDAAQFSLSTETIEAGTSETTVNVVYAPNAIGKHTVRVNVDCEAMPSLALGGSMQAYALDPSKPSTITVDTTELEIFAAKVGEKQQQSVSVTAANLPDYGSVKLKETGPFRLNTTMTMKNLTMPLTITFEPTAAGTYENEILFAALGVDTVRVSIKGIATEGTAEEETEGDALAYDMTAPTLLLNETFDADARNTPLSENGWVNAATIGTRAWWGYSFPDYDTESPGEWVAKVTAYDSKATEESQAQMLLVTPALDFKNSASKMFTFRVRGDYLTDDMGESLQLLYIDATDDEPYYEVVQGVSMPASADESGEWNEYHIDLDGLDLADVFFMGFFFNGTRSNATPATFYIDDVSYGRTDLPVIKPLTREVAFVATEGTEQTSDAITVAAENLENPIKLTLGGSNPSKFELSVSELPATGGAFTVGFKSDDLGVHEAYVKLASRGAADVYVALTVNNVSTGVAAVTLAGEPGRTEVYSLSGQLVATYTSAVAPAQAIQPLAAGTYVVKTTTASAVSAKKVTK